MGGGKVREYTKMHVGSYESTHQACSRRVGRRGGEVIIKIQELEKNGGVWMV
ncbi:hypothetical protein PI124_g14474, partial [Phytophthora idaei]